MQGDGKISDQMNDGDGPLDIPNGKIESAHGRWEERNVSSLFPLPIVPARFLFLSPQPP